MQLFLQDGPSCSVKNSDNGKGSFTQNAEKANGMEQVLRFL